jgi:uncharacterized phage-associated protein
MAVSAHDVARELRYRLPALGTLKQHKLCYYAQGWHLAWTGEPLFRERIEAWENGPVVAELWQDESKARPAPVPESLDEEALMAIDFVVSRYGRLSGRELIQLTHAEAPWNDAVAERGQSGEITNEQLRDYFRADEDTNIVQAAARMATERGLAIRAVESASRGPASFGDESDRLREMLRGIG